MRLTLETEASINAFLEQMNREDLDITAPSTLLKFLACIPFGNGTLADRKYTGREFGELQTQFMTLVMDWQIKQCERLMSA